MSARLCSHIADAGRLIACRRRRFAGDISFIISSSSIQRYLPAVRDIDDLTDGL